MVVTEMHDSEKRQEREMKRCSTEVCRGETAAVGCNIGKSGECVHTKSQHELWRRLP